jgi:hypothetical protein
MRQRVLSNLFILVSKDPAVLTNRLVLPSSTCQSGTFESVKDVTSRGLI